MSVALWWIRRDLRLADNQALVHALAAADTVVPVFVFEPGVLDLGAEDGKPLAFLLGGLRALDADLRARGSRLVVRSGDPLLEMAGLAAETGAGAIWAEEELTPAARERDARVLAALPLNLAGGLTLQPPDAALKADGQPYSVFGAFSRAWKALPLPAARSVLAAPDRLPPVPDVAGLLIPDRPALPPDVPFRPGEAEAQRRLRAFVDLRDPVLYRYAEQRDRLDADGTSQLSPYLRHGMLSVRQAAVSALSAADAAPDEAARRGVGAWINELIWREFYISLLYHWPHAAGESLNPALRALAWDDDPAALAAWREGRTGYPVVDAAMRQLAQTGWLPNRARMIAASFMVKDLLVDWRRGERWFRRHLVDGDLAANAGGWQWVAGTGTDAAPYFRVFNPTVQARRYDPAGIYVRRWLPELERVPDRYVHEPWTMPRDLQSAAGYVVGHDYPAPIVDHDRARERALLAYGRARRAA